jgi:hypothetical protein
LHSCSELFVLMLPGWDESAGIAHEIAIATERCIPIYYLDEIGRRVR